VPSLSQTLVDRLRGNAWRFLRPTPQSIALSVVRGAGLEVDLAGVAAGARRTWRDAIGVAEDSVRACLRASPSSTVRSETFSVSSRTRTSS
jgi:hypothetical protein